MRPFDIKIVFKNDKNTLNKFHVTSSRVLGKGNCKFTCLHKTKLLIFFSNKFDELEIDRLASNAWGPRGCLSNDDIKMDNCRLSTGYQTI